jgi:predicted transposase YdaD
VIRVWQEDAEKLIESGLGILPLAFIADIDPAKLPRLVKRAEERLEREATPGTIGEFWTSIDVLMGLKYQRPFVAQLLKGVRTMKESVTYQGILEEGEARGEARGEERGALRGRRDSLLRIGAKRFGPADAATQAVIEAIESADRFDDLLDRVLIASNWAELLAK